MNRRRGIGGGGASAPPTSPESGSGGGGILPIGGVSVAPAVSELSAVTTGRITLGMVNFALLAMIGFYLWTRSAQGGG
jgi:hypothetical protein